MIVTLSSTNPLFSFLIGKNPSGVPAVRSLRSGFLIGWFDDSNIQKYVIYFYDNPDICSFQPIKGVTEAKYVNVGQYSSPLILTGIITELLSNTIKKLDSSKQSEADIVDIAMVRSLMIPLKALSDQRAKDTPHQHILYISGLRIKNIKLFQTIRDTFPEITFDYKHLVGSMYELTLTANSTLFDLMNVVSLLAMLTALGNKEAITLDNGTIEKYARHISQVTAGKVANDGWYLRYLFKKRAKIPKKQLPLLETSRLKMTFGNTSDARADFIRNNLQNFNSDFVDIGCGTDLLIKRTIQKKWAKEPKILPLKETKYPLEKADHNYYLVDADPKVQEKLQNKGLNCYSSVDEFYEQNPDFTGNVIMTEVIEHNEEEDATLLVGAVLSHQPQKVFITTPNFDFNKFFGDDEIYRHDDHHWEMTEKQFQDWITDIIKDHQYQAVFMGIGDSIDGIPITSGVILNHK